MADNEKKKQEESLSVPSTIIQPQEEAESAAPGGPSLIEPEANQTGGTELSSSEPAKSPNSKSPSFLKGLFKGNTYLFMFGILILVAGGAIFAGYKISRDEAPKQQKAQSLTDQQLAALKGNTTIVGDSKQVLDVQSNSVFEGQVLVRKDLDVAGSIKIGGPLSLSGVSVGGSSTFNQVQVNDKLTVAGNTTLQGQVTVQRGLSVAGGLSVSGNLSVGTLNVTKLTVSGDFTISRHLLTSGGVPNRSAGTAVGGGGTVSVNGSDTAGTITINTGSSPPAGNFVTVTFASAYASTPHVVVTPVGSAAAGLNYYITRSNTSFTLATTNTPPAGSSFSFDYIVMN